MRFLHTADWQIGMRARHAGEGAGTVREQRLASAAALVEIARQHQVDAVLLAGDVFEDNAVPRADVQRVVDILTRFSVPVFVLPGNHDPLVAGSVWEHPGWDAPNVHVLREARAFHVRDGVRLYPCPAFARTSAADPTEWIARAGGDGLRVGIAHGTVAGAEVDEPCYPIARDAASRAGLAYLALGHWHSTASFDEELCGARMAYCGTHETTKFGERDSGNVLIVDVKDSRAPRIERIHTGNLIWKRIEAEIRSSLDVEAVFAEVCAFPTTELTLLELRLSGLVRADQMREIGRLKEIVAARFPLLGRIDDTRLRPEPGDDRWVERLSPGFLRDVAATLRADTGDGAGARALMDFYLLCAEAGEVAA